MTDPTNTFGGGQDQTAIVGHAPEARNWKPGDETFPPVIHPTARLEAFVTVDAGMIRPTEVGKGSWLFKKSHVGHDAVIGRNCEIATGAVIGGHCILGDNVKIGLNSVVRPGVTIESNARIGAGSVVTHNVPAGELWFGNPAKFHRMNNAK